MSTVDAPRTRWDVVTLGETMALARSGAVGPLAHAGSLALGIGGAESNVAIGVARLGRSVAWIGRVGNDSLGQLVSRELRAEGVHVLDVVDDEAPTGLMIKERRTTNSQQVWYYRRGSAGSRLHPDDVPTGVVEAATVLHVTGITPALSSTAADALRVAVRRARDAGTMVSLDLNYRSRLWSPDAAAPALRELAALADVVFASEDEAELLTGAVGPDEQARAIAALGPTQAVIKLGEAGCLALVDGQVHTRPAVAVEVVDTVGAGDAFVAGYLAEVVAGAAPDRRLGTAVQTGAFACTHPGDWEGAPRRDELGLLGAAEPVVR